MSKDHGILRPQILASELLDGRLAAYGVYEDGEFGPDQRRLTDADNIVWAIISSDDLVDSLRFYLPNNPDKIVRAVAKSIDARLPVFWDTFSNGVHFSFEIQEELEFHAEVLRYLAGQPNRFEPSTFEMGRVETVARLVANDPALLHPANKHRLWRIISASKPADDFKITKLVSSELAEDLDDIPF